MIAAVFGFENYLTGGTFSYDGCGWVYTTAQSGVWVNQSSSIGGNQGDITG